MAQQFAGTTYFRVEFSGFPGGSFSLHFNNIQGMPIQPPAREQLTLAEIDRELDIVRGRVPTPPGYTIDKQRVAMLMARRRELSSGSV